MHRVFEVAEATEGGLAMDEARKLKCTGENVTGIAKVKASASNEIAKLAKKLIVFEILKSSSISFSIGVKFRSQIGIEGKWCGMAISRVHIELLKNFLDVV
ncbi:hypothetical protein GOP47_0001336 [Adiantum capillus-veneris]|uniref:Uncharacterized protein n=1 Tax=Adiantum capillus-veneris TaxID=13818 RepID=A0A9D4ZMY6_ADICA|nr:hypothetical protein GOP47_0001336 [Adiantum capillus-veneris]